MQPLSQIIETLDLEEQMDRHLALVEELIYSDPKAECSPRDIPGWHTYVQRWLTQRSSNLESRWDL